MATAETKSDRGVSSRRKRSWINNLKNTSFGESRSYIFEYGLLLLLTGGLLYIVMAMIQAFYDKSFLSLPVLSGDNADIFLLSALTVTLPLVIILIQRTAETELHDPSVKNLGFRKVFLGIFLAAITVGAVIFSILFINSVLFYLSNGLLVASDFDWKTTLTYFSVASVLIITSWVFGNDYRYVARDGYDRLKHWYRYGLVIVALVVGLLFLFFPFRENRIAYIDKQIISDIGIIKSQVEDYRAFNGRLPGGLSDIDLSNEQLVRANVYGYTYELKSAGSYALCATFNSSGTTSDIGENYYYTSGLNCFDFTSGSDSSVSTVEGDFETLSSDNLETAE